MATYNSKLEDSLITKIQLFLFQKSLSKEFLIKDYYIDSNSENIVNDFTEFQITNDLANLFSNKYFQLEENDFIEYMQESKTIKEIVSSLMINTKYMLSKINIKKSKYIFEKLKDEYQKDFDIKFTSIKFNQLLEMENCSYCGINLSQIKQLGKSALLNNKRSDTRGYTLEIDRKLPNLEYSAKNCCMSCYWCNNAKTDEFSPREFKPIALGINKMWNKRLEKIGAEKINFPKNSELWEIDFDTGIKES